jgi:hypothetical protein
MDKNVHAAADIAEPRDQSRADPFECDAVPKDLGGTARPNGTLYNGPNPQFDAPGALVRRRRRTPSSGEGAPPTATLGPHPKWQAEHDAGARCSRLRRKPPDAPASVTGSGVANTNIVFRPVARWRWIPSAD